MKKFALRYQTETNTFLNKIPDNKYLTSGWKGGDEGENEKNVSSSLSFLQPKLNNKNIFVERNNITKSIISSLANNNDKSNHVLLDNNNTKYKAIGKTTLASYICKHSKIQDAYNKGSNIYWINVLNKKTTRREIRNNYISNI